MSGWSAGGHLTASSLHLDEVDAGLAISGIYDVEPCRLNYLNEKLNLSAAEAAATSPILHLPTDADTVHPVAFGTQELPELQRQLRAYHQARLDAGLPSHARAARTAQSFLDHGRARVAEWPADRCAEQPDCRTRLNNADS